MTDPKMPEPVAYADRIAFESAMRAGKGCDVWPRAGNYEQLSGRSLVRLITTDAVQAYADALAAARVAQERERCARVCSAIARGWKENPGDNPMAGHIAASNCEHEIRRAYVHLPDTQPPEKGRKQ